MKAKDKKILEAENEIKVHKNKLMDEKKLSAMLNGKIEEMKSENAKMDVLEAQIL